MRTALAVMAVMAGAAAGCRAEACAWMSAATAGGFLGAVAESAGAHGDATGESWCEFTARRGAGQVSMRMEVRAWKDPEAEFRREAGRCKPRGEALRGIGNEAVECESGRGGRRTSLVIGRVRERGFTVTVTGVGASIEPGAQAEAARRAAGFLAAALF